MQDIWAFANRIEAMGQNLDSMIKTDHKASKVLWIEARKLRATTNVHLINAELDIAERLAQGLFNRFSTTALCSATLTTNQNFEFIRERLGVNETLLPERSIIEKIYPSPFDYLNQSLLVIPTDMPAPSDSAFCDAACDKIWRSIQASRGNAFILFTSYGMMQKCYDTLAPRLAERKFPLFKQGEMNRNTLLQKYKSSDRGVLFGTDSFWEGVDVAGEALRCVVIVKLPFKVPSEPIIEARTEAITAKGGDPFYEYSVPNAIVKFKQGFGRLIRNKRDRGCIVCLDSRLISKGYGRLFLNSLPNCSKITPGSGEEMQKAMEGFYRRKPFAAAL